VRLDGVSFAYGPAAVLRDLILVVPAGAFCALLGPSGCGKTTLLKLIAGELAPQAGRVSVNGHDVTDTPPEARNIGTVYQSYALFPHLTAWKNVAFGLEVRGTAKATVTERVQALLRRVRLTRDEWHRRPAQLSGGQQQRVAIARALAFGPALLLLDEPLANLDRHLRDEMRAELQRVHAESGTTTILVTHDQEEAMATADLIGVMRGGRLLQVGPPREVYDHPRTPFVARSLGEVNILPGGGMIRPEAIPPDGPRQGTVTRVTFHGGFQMVEFDADGGPFKLRTSAPRRWAVGDPIGYDLPDSAVWTIPEADPEP
jgi:ABC-type Fe3+/spermidine/putrescine transport system ATPase subunit